MKRRTKQIHIKLTPTEFKEFTKEARKRNTSLGGFMRDCVVKEIIKSK